MRIALVAGTRPEVIKLAPVHRALGAIGGVTPIWIATGQHQSLAAQAEAALAITPDLRIPAPDPGASMTARLAAMTAELDALFAREKPDAVAVQGDTSSTLAAALAAFGRGIPVGHVEAGLRSHDRAHPFPEEQWRRLVAQIAARHFAPTPAARRHLLAEAVPDRDIEITGNTVVDAALALADGPPPDAVRSIRAAGRRLAVATVHRRENWNGGFTRICAGLKRVAGAHADLEIIFVAHANPAMAAAAERELDGTPGIRIVPPMSYPEFLRLLAASALALTDSGGVQEEAPIFGVPVLVLRETSERMEAVEAGAAQLIGTDPETIAAEAGAILAAPHRADPAWRTLFGDGQAGTRIAASLASASSWPR